MSASSKKKLRKEMEAAQLTEKQLSEQKEAKKLKAYTVTFTAVLSVVLVVAILVAAFSLISSSGILPRNVKSITVGSHTLTSTELNYFYVDAIQDTYDEWSQQYGEMLAFGMATMGLTPGKPMDEQDCPYAEGKTWAEYFADMAISKAHTNYALYEAAIADNFTARDTLQSDIDSVIMMQNYYALGSGYSSLDAYLKSIYGNGASEESFKNYVYVTALAGEYANAYSSALSYTDEDIKGYNDENGENFTSYSYSQFYIDRDDFLLCIDPNNTEHIHTADEYAPALKEAEKTAQDMVAAKPADAAALNEEIKKIELYEELNLTCDTYTDRLFLDVKKDQIEGVNEWLLEDGHKAGDITYVPIYTNAETKDEIDGYLVLLFHDMDENNMNLVNVRHILISASDTASEEDKATAKQKAEDLQAEWLKNGGTEEAFIALVKDNTEDTGSAETGGLYEDVYPGQMVTAFNDWCFDSSRKAGDYGIVQTEHGYHLMYYVGAGETTFRNFMVENNLRSEDYNTWLTGMVEKVSATVHSIKYLDLDMALTVS